MGNHGLSTDYLLIISRILSSYTDKIEIVGLFGSRAQGTYRDSSDIDIVLYGTLSNKDVDHLYTLFEDSLLPIKVDINAYHLIDYQPLKLHIDDVMTILFTRKELKNYSESSKNSIPNRKN